MTDVKYPLTSKSSPLIFPPIESNALSKIGFIASPSVGLLYPIAAIYGFGYSGNTPQFHALTGELFGLRRMRTILGTQKIFYGSGGKDDEL